MGLTSGMWTSVTGLIAHGEKMGVVSNNIANVNTVGYKGSRMDFADFVTQSVGTLAGTQQIGCGVTLGAIYGDFAQGSFETTTEATDLAISGNGFFTVKDSTTGATYYTRAGNFRFNASGDLVDPNGYVLQGWEIPKSSSNASATSTSATTSAIVGQGVPVDIKLDTFSCDPSHTSYVALNLNLSADASDITTSPTGNGFSALLETWNAQYNSGTGEWDDPLSDDSFAYQSSITVYDESGTAHVLTIYFDKVEDADGQGSESYWEFIVTMDPSEDNRTFGTDTMNDTSTGGYSGAGLLMAGVLTFNTNGQINNMVAYVPDETVSSAADLKDTSKWSLAPISSSGYPMLAANFTGREDASSIYTTGGAINTNTNGYQIEINLGYRSKSGVWDVPTGSGTTLDVVANDTSLLPGMGTSGSRNSSATTSYSGNSSERSRSQDGYTSGELSSVSVSTDGILSARYSNGVQLQLYQITLANFQCETGLYREGGNLFSATKESGNAATGAAGSGTFGSVYSNQLESSNVDLSTQLVDMIVTQRGFQANSKSITTVDTMLETVIGMKR